MGQRGGREQQRPDRISQLVARHAVERPDPIVPLLQGCRVLADERINGGTHQGANRPRQAPKHLETFFGGRLQTEPLRLRADEGLEDLFENLVFAQQLMNGCLLLVPEKTELARFVDYRGIRGDFLVGGRAQVGRDVRNQQRNVIEKLVRRKHVVQLDGQQLT